MKHGFHRVRFRCKVCHADLGPLPGGVIQYPFESRWEANSRGLAQVRQQDEGAAYAARDSQAAGSCWDWQAQLNISFLMVLS